MCGISGLFLYNTTQHVEYAMLERMNHALKHRGPDGSGAWLSNDKKIGLAHTRLAIIDLSDQATQPMASANGRFYIVYNGEIYNHAEIKQELLEIGVTQWKTAHSDTEVILKAFEYWGIACLKKFIGMFAFALWDSVAKQLWFARDRVGVKPLYFFSNSNFVAFASEIKALFIHPDIKKEVNDSALYHYLSFLTTPAPETLFKNIKKLPAGTWMMIDQSGKSITNSYWDPALSGTASPITDEAEATFSIQKALRESISARQVSDVDIGVFLSGGIDSTINATYLSKNRQSPLNTFSIGYVGGDYEKDNELIYAKHIAKQLGAKYHQRLLRQQDLIDFIPDMIMLQDEPLADPVCVPLHYVALLAKEQGIKVCQLGEGADEIFCGYPGWLLSLRLQKLAQWPMTQGIKRIIRRQLSWLRREQSSYYEWLSRAIDKQPIFWGGAEAFTQVQKQNLLSPMMSQKENSSWNIIEPIYNKFMQSNIEKSNLNWMTYLDIKLRLPELLLMRVDKMCMGSSIEARVPFLDHRLIETIFRIPQKIKLNNFKLKYLLKEAVKHDIPKDTLARKKQGFSVPLFDWVSNDLKEKMLCSFNLVCKETNYFNRHYIDFLINSKKNYHLWYLFNFSEWWRLHIYGR